MWVIFAAIGLVIFFYLNKKGNVIKRTNNEGGMLGKYSYIVKNIVSQDNRAKITHVSGDMIHIKLDTIGGKTLFILKHNENHLTIKWSMDSAIYGQHSLHWKFPSNQNQFDIMEFVQNELGSYQRKITS